MGIFILLFAFLQAQAWADGPFTPGCPVPFQGLAMSHPLDKDCDNDGTARNDGQQAQNRAKNNLCAANKPIPVFYDDFLALQKQAEGVFPFGRRKPLPASRKKLAAFKIAGRTLGEGTAVSFVGFVQAPRYADVGHGESVNCNRPKKENNDIHFSLSPEAVADLPRGGPGRNAILCKTVTAEIIPHLRPDAWEVPKLKKVAKVQLPVRVTGQLFFDASHEVCKVGKIAGGNPARESLWEIHPVYNIEVCPIRRASDCNETTWIPLAKWIK